VHYLCSKYNIEKRQSSPYHPEGNGQAKRTIRSIKTLLRCRAFSPFELMYSTKPTFSNRIVEPNINPNLDIADTPQSLMEERKHSLSTKWTEAAENVDHAKRRFKECYDKRGVLGKNIDVGEYVYAKN